MLAGGGVLNATDEEDAIDEVKLYAARLGNLEPEVLQEAADRLLKTAKVFYGLWAMDPSVSHTGGTPRGPGGDPPCRGEGRGERGEVRDRTFQEGLDAEVAQVGRLLEGPDLDLRKL